MGKFKRKLFNECKTKQTNKMLKELTTRVFQQACWTLERATDGTVNELYTVAEISGILEAWRNGEGLATGRDIPQLNDDELVDAFTLGSFSVRGLTPCFCCPNCGRLTFHCYTDGDDTFCSISCAIDWGADPDDLEEVNSKPNK